MRQKYVSFGPSWSQLVNASAARQLASVSDTLQPVLSEDKTGQDRTGQRDWTRRHKP
jgi:hypothetical protein